MNDSNSRKRTTTIIIATLVAALLVVSPILYLNFTNNSTNSAQTNVLDDETLNTNDTSSISTDSMLVEEFLDLDNSN